MLLYTFILILLSFGVYHFDYRKNILLKSTFYFFVFIVSTLMMGLRYRVGGDALVYEGMYHYLPNLNNISNYIRNFHNTNNFQPGYLYFVAVCKSIEPDYYFYQFIHSIIFNSIYFWFIKKNSKVPFTSLFISYIFLVYFYFGFEIQREMFCICCFLLSYNYFLNNKWLPYYIICSFAIVFHISAIFLLFLPFFKIINFSTRLIWFSLILSVPILLSKLIFIDLIKVFLITESMKTKGEMYSEIEFSVLGILFFYFTRVIVFVPFLIYYSKNKIFEKRYDWLFISIFWLSIFSQVMVGFDRLINYLYIPLVLFFADFLHNKQYVFTNFLGRKMVNLSCYLFLFSIIWIKCFIANFNNKYFFYYVYFPYESVFDKVETKGREDYIEVMWSQ